MGRPRNYQTRDRQLNISLTAAEYEVLHRHAYERGMRLVDFARALLFTGAAPPAQAASRFDHLIYVQLKRLGNNLNQIARHLNATGDPAPRELIALLRDIRAVLNRGLSNGS